MALYLVLNIYNMEKYIILTMQAKEWLVSKNPIYSVEDIAYTDDNGYLVIFDSFDEAVNKMEEEGISGKIIDLPLYD